MNRQVIKNRIRKILAYTFTGIVFVFISAFLTLQIPAVQDTLVDRYLGKFSQFIGFPSTITNFRLLWFDRLELEGVQIFDPEKNEMIAAKRILINFKLTNLVEDRDINIDGVVVEDASVVLTKIAESDTSRDLNINVFIHRINEHYASASGTGKNPKINIGEAVITSSKFSYIDQFRDSVKTGFNYNQFSFDIDEGHLQNFMILGDTTEFNINTLLAHDRQSGLKIKEMSSFFRLSQQSLEFTDLFLRANESVIGDSLIFTFNGQRELSEFVEKVSIAAHLKNTIVQPKDLALFAPEVKRMKSPIHINGKFKGRINNFKVSDMEVTTGKTIARGSLDMEGLPDISETFIILDLKNSRIDFNDLSFAIDQDFVDRLTPIGQITLHGQFLGYTTDFVANGDIISDLGHIRSDINFKVNESNFDRSVYSGQISLRNFDLGGYLKDTLNFQKVTMDGKIKGSGLSRSSADFALNGKIKSIGIRDYNYTNITTNARLASELFNGYIKINDPNLEFSANGSIDLRDHQELIRIEAKIDTAYLHKLNLTSKEIFIHSAIDVNSKGLHIDSLVGSATLNDFIIHYDDQHLKLTNVEVNASNSNNQREVKVNSTLLDAEVKGNFLLSDISKDIQKLVREISLSIKNNKESLSQYYKTQTYKPKSYQTSFAINIKDLEPLTELINVDFELAKNTKVEGKFTSGYTSILQAYSFVDSLSYGGKLLLDSDLEITASKIADSTDILAMAFVHSGQQVLSPKLQTRDLVLEAIWNKNRIDFTLDADQQDQNNYVRLKGEVGFLQDTTQIRMLPSIIHLLEKEWSIDEDNLITLQGKNVSINDLRVSHGNQVIVANGKVSENPDDKLSLQVDNLDLSILDPLTGRKIKGNLKALFDLTNYYTNPYIENNLTVDTLSIDGFLVGDIAGRNRWNNEERKFEIDFFIDRGKQRIVNLNGFYNPSKRESPLDIAASLQNANVKIIEPFFDYMFSNLGGTITGEYKINGTIQSPMFSGEGRVKNGKIMINYLKTLYDFDGIVGLSPNSIYFKDIQLRDILTGRAALSGTITHQNFRDTRINIDVAFENIHVLNTSSKDNTLFYGQGYASGDLNIFGPVANLKFTANAKTEKNTRISIPFGGVADIEQKDFIKFVSFRDSTFQQQLKQESSSKLDLTGITLDFNLDVTPDAYCEIILDLKAGDIIKGRGSGELQLQLDTKGEFNMFGPFEFTEGYYNFTLYDIINKDFDIKKGSRITWFGDPYAATVDISATYDQQASFGPILSNQNIANAPQLRRKYPVQVLIELDGNMFSPTTTFDIVARDLPQTIVINNNETVRLDFEFQTFKNKIDEQELKRQVFSLIVLRRFSPPESFNTSGSDVVNSVSELFSNQLSNFISQVDENLEIDVDFSRMDEEQFNTFQLRLSYTFLNGRLRITRDGTFYSNQSNNNVSNANQNISSIAGDWTVDYLLTADGKLKVKMYNRTNINPILNTTGTSNSVTTGVSLTHTQSFNELKDLWRSARKRSENKTDIPDPNTNREAVKPDDEGE